MNKPEVEDEFRELEKEILDEDPIVRGMAAIDLGTFGVEHPTYKDQIILILQRAVNDPDEEVSTNAKISIDLIEGKVVVEPEKQTIAFGYIPEEYRQPEVDQKQLIISCACCIVMIVIIIIFFYI